MTSPDLNKLNKIEMYWYILKIESSLPTPHVLRLPNGVHRYTSYLLALQNFLWNLIFTNITTYRFLRWFQVLFKLLFVNSQNHCENIKIPTAMLMFGFARICSRSCDFHWVRKWTQGTELRSHKLFLLKLVCSIILIIKVLPYTKDRKRKLVHL